MAKNLMTSISKGGGMRVKSLFFDTPKVVAMLDKKTRRVFIRFGGFVRTWARRSLRRRAPIIAKGDKWLKFGGDWKEMPTSAPGKPPFDRGGVLKRLIYFGMDPAKKTVVIGPTKTRLAGAESLEYGGPTKVYDFADKEKRTIHLKPRPFMQPAAAEGHKKLADFYKLT